MIIHQLLLKESFKHFKHFKRHVLSLPRRFCGIRIKIEMWEKFVCGLVLQFLLRVWYLQPVSPSVTNLGWWTQRCSQIKIYFELLIQHAHASRCITPCMLACCRWCPHNYVCCSFSWYYLVFFGHTHTHTLVSILLSVSSVFKNTVFMVLTQTAFQTALWIFLLNISVSQF